MNCESKICVLENVTVNSVYVISVRQKKNSSGLFSFFLLVSC